MRKSIVNHKGFVEEITTLDISINELRPKDYDRRVAELIHERYTYDAEAAMAAKHRRCYIGLCSKEEGDALKVEAIEFEKYRENCKIQAREECGMK